MMITRMQAKLIIEAHDTHMDEDDEETELLRENNSKLAEAYDALINYANGEDSE